MWQTAGCVSFNCFQSSGFSGILLGNRYEPSQAESHWTERLGNLGLLNRAEWWGGDDHGAGWAFGGEEWKDETLLGGDAEQRTSLLHLWASKDVWSVAQKRTTLTAEQQGAAETLPATHHQRWKSHLIMLKKGFPFCYNAMLKKTK